MTSTRSPVWWASLGSIGVWMAGITAADDPHPLAPEMRRTLQARFEQQLRSAAEALQQDPENISLYSRRGDAQFFLGHFGQAVEDYNRMVQLDPDQDASHWRRGIAYFFAEEFDKAAAQFSRYHSFDNVDRENGIWRYLSQYRAAGKEKARQELLRYDKDDREPFGDVYRLFAGEITPQTLMERIEAAPVAPQEREMRLFYAHLYIGLNELVEGRPETAKAHLRAAVTNTWGPAAGYGPHFMWQVARLQYEQLLPPAATTSD